MTKNAHDVPHPYNGRPIAERYWHDDGVGLGQDTVPELEPVIDEELKTFVRVKRANPDKVGRRVVSDWDGSPVWYREGKTGRRWYKLSWQQDVKLRAMLDAAGVSE